MLVAYTIRGREAYSWVVIQWILRGCELGSGKEPIILTNRIVSCVILLLRKKKPPGGSTSNSKRSELSLEPKSTVPSVVNSVIINEA